MKVTVITPTCDRPIALREVERLMARQTLRPDRWFVVDGGGDPAILTAGQTHIWRRMEPGARNFAANVRDGLIAASERASSDDVFIFIEDDDYIAPTHIERVVRQFVSGVVAAGDDLQRYYNLPNRQYRTFDNVGASLCQTALRLPVVPVMLAIARRCYETNTYGIDTTFWREIVDSYDVSLERTNTVVGLKGLPGQPGLGIGHRPKGHGWLADPTGHVLAEWIGDEDAKRYRELVPAV